MALPRVKKIFLRLQLCLLEIQGILAGEAGTKGIIMPCVLNASYVSCQALQKHWLTMTAIQCIGSWVVFFIDEEAGAKRYRMT